MGEPLAYEQWTACKELEAKLKEYLGVQYLQLTSNGTIAIQIALKAMGITGELSRHHFPMLQPQAPFFGRAVNLFLWILILKHCASILT